MHWSIRDVLDFAIVSRGKLMMNDDNEDGDSADGNNLKN